MSALDELVWKTQALSLEIVERTKNNTLRDSYVAEFANNLVMRTMHATDSLKQLKKEYRKYKFFNFLNVFSRYKKTDQSNEFVKLTKNYGNAGVMLKGIYENMTGLVLSLTHLSDEDFESLENLDEDALKRREDKLFSLKKLGNQEVKSNLRAIVNAETEKTLVYYISGFFYSQNRELYNKHRKAHTNVIKGHIFNKHRIAFPAKHIPDYLINGQETIEISDLVEGAVTAYLQNTVETLEAIVNSDMTTMKPRVPIHKKRVKKFVNMYKWNQRSKKAIFTLGLAALLASPFLAVQYFNQKVKQEQEISMMKSVYLTDFLSNLATSFDDKLMNKEYNGMRMHSPEEQEWLDQYLSLMPEQIKETYKVAHENILSGFRYGAVNQSFKETLDSLRRNHISISDYRAFLESFGEAKELADSTGAEISDLFAEKILIDQEIHKNYIFEVTITDEISDNVWRRAKLTNSMKNFSREINTILNLVSENSNSFLKIEVEDEIAADLITARAIQYFVENDGEKVTYDQVFDWMTKLVQDVEHYQKPMFGLKEGTLDNYINTLCEKYNPENNGGMLKYFLENHTAYFKHLGEYTTDIDKMITLDESISSFMTRRENFREAFTRYPSPFISNHDLIRALLPQTYGEVPLHMMKVLPNKK